MSEEEKNVLFKLVLGLGDAWDDFLESINEIEITIKSAKLLVPVLKKFKELKQYAGILKK